MAFVDVKCPQCGANLQLEEGRDSYFCSYCGAKFELEKKKVEVCGTVKVEKEIKKTYKEPAKGFGVVFLILGLPLIIVGFAILKFTAAGGIFFLIMGGIALLLTYFCFSGKWFVGRCPYCGCKVFGVGDRSKCNACGKVIDSTGNTLKTMDY